MRKIALLSVVVAVAMAFANVSSASALSWSPQNTNVGFSGALSFFWNAEGAISCPSQSWTGKASGAVLNWNAPSFSCSSRMGSTPMTFSGQWSQTATSTSSVTLKADTVPSGGTVLSFSGPSAFPGCGWAVKGPITATAQAWDNTKHQMTLDPIVATVQGTGGNCNIMSGSTLTIKGSVVTPAASILP